MRCNRNDLLLYAVTDRSWLNGKALAQQVEEVLKGGATMLQLREKDLDRDSFRAGAVELKQICKQYHVPFLINDNVELAVEVGAGGVHVGQRDMEAARVREKVGPNAIVGVSVQTVEQALAGSGIAGAAVVSALFAQPDGERAARELRDLLEKAVSP